MKASPVTASLRTQAKVLYDEAMSREDSLMYAFDPQKPEDEARRRAVVLAAEITD